jgi:hypothetical protein
MSAFIFLQAAGSAVQQIAKQHGRDWTKWEAVGILAEAGALVLILIADTIGLFLLIDERKLQREARREERDERRQQRIARQRAEVTCGGVTEILRNMDEASLCRTLHSGQFRHPGFAFESGLYAQLPEYLRLKCEPFMNEVTRAITPEQNRVARRLLVYRFPYPDFDVIFDDICRLNFGNTLLAWDENGTPMRLPRD